MYIYIYIYVYMYMCIYIYIYIYVTYMLNITSPCLCTNLWHDATA